MFKWLFLELNNHCQAASVKCMKRRVIMNVRVTHGKDGARVLPLVDGHSGDGGGCSGQGVHVVSGVAQCPYSYLYSHY